MCNAPATLQHRMLSLFSDMVKRFLEIFIDDFSIYGDSFDQCLHHLKLVLKRCMKKIWHLTGKVSVMVKKGIILGHEVSSKGIQVDKAKVEVIAKLPKPNCIKNIRSFLGHVRFYRRSIKKFCKVVKPLTNLLVKNVPFYFDDGCLKAWRGWNENLSLPQSSRHLIRLNH